MKGGGPAGRNQYLPECCFLHGKKQHLRRFFMYHSKQKSLPFILTIFSFMVTFFIPFTVHWPDVTFTWGKPDASRVMATNIFHRSGHYV